MGSYWLLISIFFLLYVVITLYTDKISYKGLNYIYIIITKVSFIHFLIVFLEVDKFGWNADPKTGLLDPKLGIGIILVIINPKIDFGTGPLNAKIYVN